MPVFESRDPRATIFPGGGLLDALASSGLGQYIGQGLERRFAEQQRRRERAEDAGSAFIQDFLTKPAEEQAKLRASLGQMTDDGVAKLTKGAFQTATQLEAALPVRGETKREALGTRGLEADVRARESEATALETSNANALAKANLDLAEMKSRLSALTGETNDEVLTGMLTGQVAAGRFLSLPEQVIQVEAAKKGLTPEDYKFYATQAMIQASDLTAAQIEQLAADTDATTRLIGPRIDALRAEAASRNAESAFNATVFQSEMVTRDRALRWITGGIDPATNAEIPSLIDRIRTKQFAPGDPFAGVETPEDIVNALGQAAFMLPETPGKRAMLEELNGIALRHLAPYFQSLGATPPTGTGTAPGMLGFPMNLAAPLVESAVGGVRSLFAGSGAGSGTDPSAGVMTGPRAPSTPEADDLRRREALINWFNSGNPPRTFTPFIDEATKREAEEREKARRKVRERSRIGR